VTVRDWIANRKPPAPPALQQQILGLLGPEADQPDGRTSQVCLDAAARALEEMVMQRRFAREHAAELLAIDALTTYAFEYASLAATSSDALEETANRGTHIFARIAERV
jgi:hypothetical protein